MQVSALLDKRLKVPQADEQFINYLYKEILNLGHDVFLDEM